MSNDKYVYIDGYGVCFYYGMVNCINHDTFATRREPIYVLPSGQKRFFKSKILKKLTTKEDAVNDRRKSLCHFILNNKT